MYRLLFVAAVCLGATRHPELRGEEPEQSDIDLPGLMCVGGFPTGDCAAECHSINTAPTCGEDGVCYCQHLEEPSDLALSRVLLELEAEARRTRIALHECVLTSALVYLAAVGLLFYCRRRRNKYSHVLKLWPQPSSHELKTIHTVL